MPLPYRWGFWFPDCKKSAQLAGGTGNLYQPKTHEPKSGYCFPACYAHLHFCIIFTVVLALRKPMKIVSRISPIEATRYLENAENTKKGKRKWQKKCHRFSPMANITGNRKRTIATILPWGFPLCIVCNYVN